ncbi:MAG: hypothetical protein M3354_09495 [Chloroflexota bacterium]|nr:hypothetical protein [Chloroflexota bacterium]
MIERDDESRGILLVSAEPIHDTDGRRLAAVATFHDISQQRFDAIRQQVEFEVSTVLSSSRDVLTKPRRVSRLLIPHRGSLWIIGIIDERGRIWTESAGGGRGANFSVWLPHTIAAPPGSTEPLPAG